LADLHAVLRALIRESNHACSVEQPDPPRAAVLLLRPGPGPQAAGPLAPAFVGQASLAVAAVATLRATL